MASLLERVPVDRIEVEADKVEIGRMLLTLLAGFFYVLGWLIGKFFLVVGTIIRWSIAAAKVGWEDAHQAKPMRPRRMSGPA